MCVVNTSCLTAPPPTTKVRWFDPFDSSINSQSQWVHSTLFAMIYIPFTKSVTEFNTWCVNTMTQLLLGRKVFGLDDPVMPSWLITRGTKGERVHPCLTEQYECVLLNTLTVKQTLLFSLCTSSLWSFYLKGLLYSSLHVSYTMFYLRWESRTRVYTGHFAYKLLPNISPFNGTTIGYIWRNVAVATILYLILWMPSCVIWHYEVILSINIKTQYCLKMTLKKWPVIFYRYAATHFLFIRTGE